jgi:hypothetical protein
MLTVFEKTYDGESIVDLSRDISEAFDRDFNPTVESLTQDKWGFWTGQFRVKVEWTNQEQN